ncbi:uncharacterized protein K452DRAFT_98095 [Aplosporella prunicola CBS 121167]|uniref:Zn(2)-C6 fungal-type domain-containing protein n=1 Tax=Aplosporella prunicola CBS 121167 TaxID=1176127 RepID=A0A6A6B0P2_9PEZI|nr:uncharacterized protein K452DRAFT_98095 [Aplosporella prunicola CBS 121167]KAF2137752.1 hypothetical protein K452DRAFT_98095 [Aplosporella prunicola CBS 121167]
MADSPAAADSLRVCALCDKPFMSEPSYARHVSYCRNSQIRPRHRQRSCRNCSLAKVKCSFEPRCSRCIAKGLDCLYDHPASTRKTKPVILDTNPPPLPDCGFLATADLFTYDDDMSLGNIAGLLSPPTANATDKQVPSDPLHLPTEAHSTIPNAIDLGMSADHVAPQGVPWLGRSALASDNTNSALTNAGFLAHVPIHDPVAQYSATIVMQALQSFPRMMLRRPTFPPFIHPHWHYAKSPLPESLTNCMGIAHVFVSTSIETRPFLWQTIEREQQRFLTKVDQMPKEDLLAAVQAQVIYIIMKVVINDPQQSAESNLQMLLTFQTLCERLMKLLQEPFCLSEQISLSSTWEEWILAESRRRTACVWFLISRLVSVRTGIPCDAVEQFLALPLPSPKVIWETSTRDMWVSEHDACGTAMHEPDLVNFGGLIESHKRRNEPAHARKLDTWNAESDHLGSLLNVTVAMI